MSEYFQLYGRDEPADLKVVTVATGGDADVLREQSATTGRDKIQKSHQDFYSRFYPQIKIAQPFQFSDDEQQNRIELALRCQIRWQASPSTPGLGCANHFM